MNADEDQLTKAAGPGIPPPEGQNGTALGAAAKVGPLSTQDVWVTGLLALLTVLFFGDLFFAGRTLAMRDTYCDFLPWRLFAAKELHAGHLPLWNSYDFGKPFAADPQTAVFYPLHLVFLVLPAAWALKISWAVHLWIAAVSMFALARYWGLQRTPALIASISFAFGTLPMAYMEFFSEFTAAVWGPLILLLVSQVADACMAAGAQPESQPHSASPRRRAALLTLIVAVQYLAGHPEVFLETLLMSGLLVLVRAAHWRSAKGLARAGAWLTFAGLLAFVLLLPQFSATWELIRHSERAKPIDPDMGSASIPPKQLLGLFAPFLFGRTGNVDTYWAQSVYEFWAGTCYVGLLPLLLAAFAALYLRSGDDTAEAGKPLLLLGLAMLLFGFLMALGQYSPFYKLVVDHVPMFNRIRWPAKYLLWVPYGLALLAGLGYQAILDYGARLRTPGARRKLAIATALCCALGLAEYALVRRHPAPFLRWLAGDNAGIAGNHVRDMLADSELALGFLMAGLGIVWFKIVAKKAGRWVDAAAVAFAFSNLLLISRQVQPVTSDAIYQAEPVLPADHFQGERVLSPYATGQWYLYGRTNQEFFSWTRRAGVGDTWLPFGIHHAWQGGMKVERYNEFLAKLLTPESASRFADLASAHYELRGEAMDRVAWIPGTSKALQVIERRGALPRAYLVDHWTELRNPAQVLDRVGSASFDPWHEAVVEPRDDGGTVPPPASGAGSQLAQAADSLVDDAERVAVTVHAGAPSLLVLTDTWFPGWHVSVDGRERPIFRANFLFRGVFLDPGEHRILFSYLPWQFRRGVWSSALSAVFLFCMVLWPVRQRPPVRQV